jgi:SAM-dependent methyltransferase
MRQWDHGDAYDSYIGRWSRRVAPKFLSWLGLPPGLDWLDVGCGTGALAEAIVECCDPRSVTGVEPSPEFRERASVALGPRVRLLEGSATSIPLDDEAVDVVVSGLVLNFVTDHRAALAAMTRVSRTGGVVAAYVWDYSAGMQLLRHFWDAAVGLDPAAKGLDEGGLFDICRDGALNELFAGAGLQEVRGTAIAIETTFSSFSDCWEPFLGGQGPAPSYVSGLNESSRARLRESFRARLPIAEDGTIALTARGWAVRGRVAVSPRGSR